MPVVDVLLGRGRDGGQLYWFSNNANQINLHTSKEARGSGFNPRKREFSFKMLIDDGMILDPAFHQLYLAIGHQKVLANEQNSGDVKLVEPQTKGTQPLSTE